LSRDPTGAADERDFGVGFNDAQLVEQAGEPAIIVERVFRADLLHETCVAGLHLDDGAVVLIGV